jgi:hypothetical protein
LKSFKLTVAKTLINSIRCGWDTTLPDHNLRLRRNPIIIELQNPLDLKTITQITNLIRKSLINTSTRELYTIVESLFTSNAILIKTNAEFVINARKPKDKKRLITTAIWLTTEDAQELRQKQKTKEDAVIAKKRAATKIKANIKVRKIQKAVYRIVRLI